jgi:hypothetical protein
MRARDPAAAVLAALVGPATRSLTGPDPKGTAELVVHGRPSKATLAMRQDMFAPTWTVQWNNVALDTAVVLRVSLVDADTLIDDAIGSFELDADDLREALRRGNTLQVRVNDQTQDRVLFAAIAVTAVPQLR